ncbi:MAG: UbiA family prenyltransferase [bacterium]|nr:UbiA family prenyltransferase [bacterium]
MSVIKPVWFDPLFILRPTLFFPSWTFFLAGFARGQGTGTAWYIIWLAAALGASFLLNQVTDRKEDHANRKLLPLWAEKITLRMVRVEFFILVGLVVIGCVWVGPEISALLALFFVNAGILYNFPPFRLKARPVWGVLSCAIGIWNGYLIGARCADVAWLPALAYGLPYAFAGAAVSLLTSIPDLKGDIKAGVRTFAAVYGVRKTGGWAVGLVIVSALLSLYLVDFYLFAAALLSLPFFVRFSLVQSAAAAELAIKIAIFSLAVAIGITWLPFLAIMAFYYPFSRWYHRTRLGLDYPSFKPRAEADPEKRVFNIHTGKVSAVKGL